ncbi:MAG: bifunctional folylpolyglutamate synthase/dihydrofolate synthase [Lachnospiraceae bacterium]|nr:bifunctional folylpolyglutamate synthase/dihydrofolate synthase [Lachnospiraceae bacterium]
MNGMSTGERRQKMEEAVEYLDSTPLFAKKSSLENVRKYLELFGHPERGMKIIHVAGTNGKGSVCARIASCLREAGFSVGLFISPHLAVIRERMSINGEMISEEEFLYYFEIVKKECIKGGPDALPHLLYFEMLFMMAMLWFRDKKPDYLVLETGLGGRLDATNSIEDKAVTVITRIGIDHTAYLGDTIAEIAAEKAGILRKGCPAVFLTEPEEAWEVIREKAGQAGAPVFELSPKMWKVNKADENGIDFSLDNRYDKNLRITIADRAPYQCENTALAVTACGILLREAGKYDPDLIVRGIEKTSWPGRMEEILPRVWIDGAHNPDGIRAFLESAGMIIRTERERAETGRVFLLFSCVKDKSYREELKMISLSGLFTDIAAVPMGGSRALDAETLRACVEENMNRDSERVTIHETASVKEAAETFIMRRDSKDLVFAAGSLYLIGELRSLLAGLRSEAAAEPNAEG